MSVGLRPEEVESSEEGLEFGESEEFVSTGANVDAQIDKSEDKAPYVFPRDAPA